MPNAVISSPVKLQCCEHRFWSVLHISCSLNGLPPLQSNPSMQSPTPYPAITLILLTIPYWKYQKQQYATKHDINHRLARLVIVFCQWTPPPPPNNTYLTLGSRSDGRNEIIQWHRKGGTGFGLLFPGFDSFHFKRCLRGTFLSLRHGIGILNTIYGLPIVCLCSIMSNCFNLMKEDQQVRWEPILIGYLSSQSFLLKGATCLQLKADLWQPHRLVSS